ncbi:MAG: DUF4249 family protein [Bacteroidetes bacterium]|nr:DUF4249 family protein [Bacteroidota bacterium]
MRKTLLYISGIALAFIFASCSEKFDVAAPYKNVTIVTGFMDIRDTAHYIRIEKGFLDNNKSGLDMAKVADSSYYANIDVKIKEIDPGTSAVVNTFTLPRVDMNNEGYPKDSGTFFNTPNYAYKFKQPLHPQYKYRLVITNNDSHEVDSAETAIIDTAVSGNHFFVPIIETPTQPYVINISHRINAKQAFSGTIVGNTQPDAVPAGIYTMECLMKIYYRDSNSNTNQTASHVLTWNNVPATITIRSASFDFTLENTTFYDFFQENITATPDIHSVWRLLDSCDLYLYAGSHDYYTYKQVVGAQQSSLTGGEIKPNYSNIKGGVVLGLYTTRTYKVGKAIKFVVPASIDSLRADPRTSAINFTVPTP